MKRVLTITLIVTIFLNAIMLSGCSKELQIMINGKNIVDETTIITKDNEFYIPIDALCKYTNVTYDYIPDKNEITITNNQKGLKMFFNKDIVCIEGINKKADNQPFIDNATIYVPLCYTMNLLGYNVNKNNCSKITIMPKEYLIEKKMYDGENVYCTYYEYDGVGNLIKETNNDGEVLHLYEYSDNGKLNKEEIFDAFEGNEIIYKYNESGKCVEKHQTLGDGSYNIHRYDDNGNIIYHEWENGITEYIYDEGRIVFEECKREDGKPYKVKYEYEEHIQTKQITYEDGQEKVEVRDRNGNFLVQGNPELFEAINYYENSIEIIGSDFKGKWEYNEQNLMTKKELVYEAYDYTDICLYEYDEYGNLLTQKDGTGNVMIKTYDKEMNLVEEKLMNGNVHKYKYNENNRLISDEIYNSSGELKSKYEYFYK